MRELNSDDLSKFAINNGFILKKKMKNTVLVDLVQFIDRKTPDWLDHKPKRKSKSKLKVLATKFSTEKPSPAVTRRQII